MENKTFKITTDLWASQGQRFLNYIIDWAIQFGLAFVLTFVIGIIALALGNQSFVERVGSMGKFEEYLLGIVIALVYYALFEIFFSRTIAKFITKTVVVMEDGSKPDTGTIVKRTFCRLIPFNVLSFVGNPRGWHDSISDTYVVKKDALDSKKRLFYSFDEIGKHEE